MPKSKKRPKDVARQRHEKRRQQESLRPPLTLSLPTLRSSELNHVLETRENWDLDTALIELMDSWLYRPSIPDDWDDTYEGGGTSITPTEQGRFEVTPPSFDDQNSKFQLTYASVQDLFLDIEAIEQWRHPVSGPPPGLSHAQEDEQTS